jgi:hypothetical protein
MYSVYLGSADKVHVVEYTLSSWQAGENFVFWNAEKLI